MVLALALAPGSASAFGCQTDTVSPVATFTFSPPAPEAGTDVFFDASSSQGGSHRSYNYEPETGTCEPGDWVDDSITSFTWHWGDGTSDTFTTNSTAFHKFASAGVYDVKVTAHAGLAGSDSVTHSVATAWHVTLTQPAPSTFWTQDLKRATITLAATADGPEPVQKVEFYVRGAKVGEDSSAPYSISFDTASIGDGPATILARAVGTGGSAGSSPWRDVKIDNTPPAFTLVSEPGVVQPGHDTFTVRFTDDEFLYGNAVCWAEPPHPLTDPIDYHYCVGAGVSQTFEGSYTFGLGEGRHTVHFEAWDAADNATVGTATVTVDGTPPDTTLGDAASGFALGSSEPDSTFRCRVYDDGGAAPSFAPCPAATSGLAPGIYRYEAVAVDAAGNEDPTPAARTFTVTAPPSNAGGDGSGGGGGSSGGDNVGPSAEASGGTPPIQTPQGGTYVPPRSTAGRCAKLRGKKRAACVRRNCARAKKQGRKKYRACAARVTRKR